MSEDIVFVCTADGCDAGPWEGSHDAMAHCSEYPDHGYTGRPRSEIEPAREVIPATATRKRDNRNLQHKGHPEGAYAQND